MLRRAVLLSVVWLAVSGCATDRPDEAGTPDYLIMAYSGGVLTAGLPRTSLLDDPVHRAILNACVSGASLADLTRLEIDSLEERIDRLCEGRVLACEDSVFRPRFPFFTGTDRARLDSTAAAYADGLVEPVSDLLEQIRLSGDVPPGSEFHVLWSLIIDQTWYATWERLYPGTEGPPQVIWIADPPHDYSVGTNHWQLPGGSMASATWGPRCDEHLRLLMPLRLELLRAAWDMPRDHAAGETTLRRYGFLDADGAYSGVTYRDSTAFADRLSVWREVYSDAVAGITDIEAAAAILGVPVGQAFVILLHETPYVLFQRLAEAGVLEFPMTLATGEPVDQIADLVSVRLVRRPLPEDIAMAVLMANGWHGSEEVIPLFRQVLATDPQNLQIRLFLAMSLYDLERYDEAVAEFEDLSRRVADDPDAKRLYDWSRVWLGHVYDAKGERARAIEWYQAVVNDGSAESEMSFRQYRIGKTDAVSWAQERLSTPFEWR